MYITVQVHILYMSIIEALINAHKSPVIPDARKLTIHCDKVVHIFNISSHEC